MMARPFGDFELVTVSNPNPAGDDSFASRRAIVRQACLPGVLVAGE
jgi:hypothetical protein